MERMRGQLRRSGREGCVIRDDEGGAGNMVLRIGAGMAMGGILGAVIFAECVPLLVLAAVVVGIGAVLVNAGAEEEE